MSLGEREVVVLVCNMKTLVEGTGLWTGNVCMTSDDNDAEAVAATEVSEEVGKTDSVEYPAT